MRQLHNLYGSPNTTAMIKLMTKSWFLLEYLIATLLLNPPSRPLFIQPKGSFSNSQYDPELVLVRTKWIH
jgi:hypothetical protein